MVKVDLGAGAVLPTRVGALALATGNGFLDSGEIRQYCGAFDAVTGYAYFGVSTTHIANWGPGSVVKVDMSGVGAPTRASSLTLFQGDDMLGAAATRFL